MCVSLGIALETIRMYFQACSCIADVHSLQGVSHLLKGLDSVSPATTICPGLFSYEKETACRANSQGTWGKEPYNKTQRTLFWLGGQKGTCLDEHLKPCGKHPNHYQLGVAL